MIKVTNENDRVTLQIESFINIKNISELDRAWNEQVQKKPKTIVLDCSYIQTIDSPAIGMLVKFKQDAFAHQVELILENVTMPVFDFLQITNLTRFFSIKSIVGP